MNQKLLITSTVALLTILMEWGHIARANTMFTTKRVVVNGLEEEAIQVDVTLLSPFAGDIYTWLKIEDSTETDAVMVSIPEEVARGGGTIPGITPPGGSLKPGEELMIIISHLRKSGEKHQSVKEVKFTDLMGNMAIDDEPQLPVTRVEKREEHSSTTDGLGGNSPFAMVLSNFGTEPITINNFLLYENVDSHLFAQALELSDIPDNLFRDPISVTGTGQIVDNIMSTFTIAPSEEIAFHFSSNVDPSQVVISTGFCFDEYECSTGDMVPPSVPEPTSTLSLLAFGTLGMGSVLKRKLNKQKSTEKETAKVG